MIKASDYVRDNRVIPDHAHDRTADTAFEPVALINASDVLPPDTIKGPRHTVDPLVYNNGLFNYYRVQSAYGPYDVSSTAALQTLIHEIDVITQLEETSRGGVVVGEVADTAKGIALAPVNSVRSAVKVVTQPKTTLKMVMGVPKGLARLFGFARDTVAKGTNTLRGQCAGRHCDNDREKEEKGVGKTVVQGVGAGTDLAEDFVRDQIGYDSRIAAWQQKVGIDPHSTNTALHREIRGLARLETGIGLALDFVPFGIGLPIGGEVVGQINRVHGRLEDVALYSPPGEQRVMNRLKLAKMGATEAEVDAFFSNTHLNGTLQTRLLTALEALQDVDNRNAIVRRAGTVDARNKALFLVNTVTQLADTQQKGLVIDRFLETQFLPVIQLSNGRTLIPLQNADHLVWTWRTADYIRDALNHPEVTAQICLIPPETASPRALQEIRQHNIMITSPAITRDNACLWTAQPSEGSFWAAAGSFTKKSSLRLVSSLNSVGESW